MNPDRISLPDIDVDFDDDGRGRVLNWVTQKYGKEKVAHIITYGTMATKLAIKDVARVQKLLLSESDRLCKLVPDKIPDKKLNLQNAIDYVPELKAAEQSSDPVLRDTIRYAKMLEGKRPQYGRPCLRYDHLPRRHHDWVRLDGRRQGDRREDARHAI